MSDVEKAAKKVVDPVGSARRSLLGRGAKKIEKSTIRTGASAARRDAAGLAAQQLQREKANLAEATDEVARREAGATGTRGGRRSLIKSSPTGLAKTLGG